jgi:hypothetical protein
MPGREAEMWLTVLTLVTLVGVGLATWVGVRQQRHPVPPGPRRAKEGYVDPDNRDCPWSF